MYATNIKWDIDLEENESYAEALAQCALPTSVKLPDWMVESSDISDWLTERYGFCHKGFLVEQED